ncbi:MAG: DeoR family transcriptional regulator [Gammaproteobacteria bacterium]|nr:DeoR family transcriptional regulator [Gammaproteobacteria bacterium]
MTKRNTQQRRNLIMQQLQQHGEITVEELVSRHQTSEVTIRKDLSELERSGLLIRKFGGAIPIPKEIVEDRPANEALESIGRSAASMIKDYSRVILDSGRTTTAIVPFLSGRQGLVVMTNSLDSANQLLALEKPPSLLMTGGTYDPSSESFQGSVAEQSISSYDFDYLFIGADGIDLSRGTTTFNELRNLSRVMAQNARKVVVVAEASKVGRRIPNLELQWQDIHTLVTDSTLTDDQKDTIESHGVEIKIA